MSSNNTRPKRTAEENGLVHTVTSGPVLADIYRGATPDGHAYLYYVVSRAWRPRSGVRENYSNRFYERNETQIVEIAQRASEWIRRNPRAADQQCQPRQEGPPRPAEPHVPAQTPLADSPQPGNGRGNGRNNGLAMRAGTA